MKTVIWARPWTSFYKYRAVPFFPYITLQDQQLCPSIVAYIDCLLYLTADFVLSSTGAMSNHTPRAPHHIGPREKITCLGCSVKFDTHTEQGIDEYRAHWERRHERKVFIASDGFMSSEHATIVTHIANNPNVHGILPNHGPVERSIKRPPGTAGKHCTGLQKPSFESMKDDLHKARRPAAEGSAAQSSARTEGHHQEHTAQHHTDRIRLPSRPRGTPGGVEPRATPPVAHNSGAEPDYFEPCHNCAWSIRGEPQDCVKQYREHWEAQHEGYVLVCNKDDHLCLHQNSMDNHFEHSSNNHNSANIEYIESYVKVIEPDGLESVHERDTPVPDWDALHERAKQYQNSHKKHERKVPR